MKPVLVSLLLIAVVGFSSKKVANEKATATVNQINGVYIFVDSQPTSEYTFLGSVKTSGVVSMRSGQYQPVRDALIKKIKKDWPEADGVIFHFLNGGADKADAIKFK